MREIKFRAWDTSWNFMINNVWCLEFFDEWRMVVNEEFPAVKVMQFTWLKDSKWVEIYEGDIVKVKRYSQEKLLTVEWLEMIPCCWCCVENHWPWWNFDDNVPIEVVWNIYESPTEVTSPMEQNVFYY